MKSRAASTVEQITAAESARRDELLDEVAQLREEMIQRLGDDDDDATGVREPRKPRPGGSAAAVAADPVGSTDDPGRVP